jgi:DNA-binding winged helix-turn-helix (wHTH) protein
MPRYRFASFIVSPRRRVLVCDGRETPLIPRYFDLLVFLLERRHEAVHRREIFDRVWADVIVSDSALSQAIRTLRRTLGDDPREPRFIRTVSRHGYRFVCPDVVEEHDEDQLRVESDSGPVGANPGTGTIEHIAAGGAPTAAPVASTDADPFEPLVVRLTAGAADGRDDDQAREAAELLHVLGTSAALRRLGTRPGHAFARAMLRDTRWETAGAGAVPLVGQPGTLEAAAALVRLRLRRAARAAAARWTAGSLGGGLAGAAAGLAGGLVLLVAPGTTATAALVPVLVVIGGVCGALGGAGTGAGLSVAEAAARSRQSLALVAGGAAGGGAAGLTAQLLAAWSLETLLGLAIPIGGGIEGLVIGGAAGLGYASSISRTNGGLAAPRGTRRLRVAGVTGAACAAAALALTLAGRPLVGGTLHRIGEASQGTQAILTPIGRLVGETQFGPLSRAIIGAGEGALFGIGLALGLTRRPART